MAAKLRLLVCVSRVFLSSLRYSYGCSSSSRTSSQQTDISKRSEYRDFVI